LGNAKKLVDEFKGRLEVEVRRQERIEESCCIGGMIKSLRRNI